MDDGTIDCLTWPDSPDNPVRPELITGAQMPPVLAIRCKLGKNAVRLLLDTVLPSSWPSSFLLLWVRDSMLFCSPTPLSAPPQQVHTGGPWKLTVDKPHTRGKTIPGIETETDALAVETSSFTLMLGLVQPVATLPAFSASVPA